MLISNIPRVWGFLLLKNTMFKKQFRKVVQAYKKLNNKKLAAGILGLFSMVSIPVSGFMSSDQIMFDSKNQLPANSVLESYASNGQLRTEQVNSNNSLIVNQTSLAALARVESGETPSVKQKAYVPVNLKQGYVPVTAYSSTVDQTDSTPFITANGSHVYDGTIAANFLPFGTKVKFPEYSGDKIYTVEDRMNKRYNYKIDIWFTTRQDALEFGKQTLYYEVVG